LLFVDIDIHDHDVVRAVRQRFHESKDSRSTALASIARAKPFRVKEKLDLAAKNLFHYKETASQGREVTVNKTQLIEEVGAAAALEKRQAERAVDAVMSTVMQAVRTGNRVALVGFGTFKPTRRNARMGRNPQTGAPVRINASKGVRFAAGSAFKEALNTNRPTKKTNKAGAGRTATSKRAPATKRPAAKKAPVKNTTRTAKAVRKR
jgi:DNA-binding protein HU-beta